MFIAGEQKLYCSLKGGTQADGTGGARAAIWEIGTKLNLWVSCRKDDLNGVGMFIPRMSLPAATAIPALVPAS